MNRLHAELQRLYRLDATASGPAPDKADEPVHAMVLTLSRPADWAALSAVWQSVQSELGLPAPAIAVSGFDGYQLWFSLAQPQPAAQAMGFLEALRLRYLPEVAHDRVGLSVSRLTVPAQQTEPDRWSAFVAPDLAPVFADTPWLDIPPNPDGQAELLARLHSIKPADWQHALTALQPLQKTEPDVAPSSNTRSPRGFLLSVMNDEALDLSLRIQAAQALLPYVS
ncbi:MAG: hypothetical protein C0487_05640 [Leptothrix sp. (in: Bacteria)]|nr:hypothetical protein [Leptothrix sp. (in: b-proteobacteria)]